MCKNVYAINNDIIVLTFHELDLTKNHGRGLHGPKSDMRPVPSPVCDFSNGPANERRFFQRTGPEKSARADLYVAPPNKKKKNASIIFIKELIIIAVKSFYFISK